MDTETLHEMTTQRHPLEAVPIRAPDVRATAAGRCGLLLERILPARGRLQTWADRLFGSRRRSVLLDSRGAAFWKLCDGTRTLRETARLLSESWEIGPQEANEAVVLCTRDLMLRRLLYLELPQAGEATPKTNTP